MNEELLSILRNIDKNLQILINNQLKESKHQGVEFENLRDYLSKIYISTL